MSGTGTPARTRRSSHAASPPPPSKTSLPHPAQVPSKNEETVLTRRKHTADAALKSSATAARVFEAPPVQIILRSVAVLARFFALFFAVAPVDVILVYFIFAVMSGRIYETYFESQERVLAVLCPILAGSFIGLLSGIYFKRGGGFRRAIVSFVFVLIIFADFIIALSMHEIWSGSCFLFEETYFYTREGSCANFRLPFFIFILIGSILGIAAAFFFRDFIVGE
jgi:hypothetical protein